MRWARTAAAVALMCLGIHGPVAAETRYSFAVVPQYGARTLFTIWKPIVDDVARRTGIALDLDTKISSRLGFCFWSSNVNSHHS